MCKSKKYRQHNDQKEKDKQQSTKHTHKIKDRVTQTPLKTGDELRCTGRVSSSCSTSGTSRVKVWFQLFKKKLLLCRLVIPTQEWLNLPRFYLIKFSSFRGED